jgi:hypothetical protein
MKFEKTKCKNIIMTRKKKVEISNYRSGNWIIRAKKNKHNKSSIELGESEIYYRS